MARIPGIQIEKDKKGRVAYVRINVKKHPEFILELEKVGAIEYNDFEKEWNDPTNVTFEEAKKHTLDHINSLQWKK
jgi:hypothetical protein